MPPVSVLIKPASSACNMSCGYCFYKDEAQNRSEYFTGMMTVECAEIIIKKAMDFAEESCSFMFQGGEPTLRGLDFFKSFVELQKKHSKPGVKVFNSIQTNGLLIDDEWAEFLAKNGFLTGLSLDGSSVLHNIVRKDSNGNDTYQKVIAAAKTMQKHNAEFNILCVLSSINAMQAEKLYHSFKQQGFKYLQFIPCLEPLDGTKGSYTLTPKAYTDFLIKIFNLWYNDFVKGEYISIRHIDNFVGMALGRCPENCGMSGRCSIQFVTEGNGDVYPCDFYVLDEYILGSIYKNSFSELIASQNAKSFISESLNVPQQCKSCRFYSLCRCGCRRERLPNGGKNRFCESYKEFFSRCGKKIMQAAQIVQANNP